jgi:hypothetical protein
MISILHKSLQTTVLRRSVLNTYAVSRAFSENIEKSNADEVVEEAEKKLGGFAKAYEKFSQPEPVEQKVRGPDPPFATLLKNSKFVEVSD